MADVEGRGGGRPEGIFIVDFSGVGGGGDGFLAGISDLVVGGLKGGGGGGSVDAAGRGGGGGGGGILRLRGGGGGGGGRLEPPTDDPPAGGGGGGGSVLPVFPPNCFSRAAFALLNCS